MGLFSKKKPAEPVPRPNPPFMPSQPSGDMPLKDRLNLNKTSQQLQTVFGSNLYACEFSATETRDEVLPLLDHLIIACYKNNYRLHFFLESLRYWCDPQF